MIEKLPYELTPGVTATQEGLYFSFVTAAKLVLSPTVIMDDDPYDGKYGNYWLAWPEVALLVEYTPGVPWCRPSGGDILCINKNEPPAVEQELMTPYNKHFSLALNRIAAIVCDDGEAFRVLHWCINNLEQEYGT